LGLSVIAFVEIALDKTTPALFEQFKNMAQDIPEIVECHMIAGGFDFLLKVRTSSMDAFRRFLGERLASIPGMAQTHTFFSLEAVKANDYLPLRAPRNPKRSPSIRPRRGTVT
jgi:Lrp/AsnC family leucine-responsive transcriptional regulator